VNDDADLRRALAAADAAAPPSTGAAITWASLQARLRRQRLRHALAATLVLTCGAAATAWLRTPANATAPTTTATLAELRLQLDALRARLDVLDDGDATVHELQRRGDVAALRATTAISHAPIAVASFPHATPAPPRAPSPNPAAGSAGPEDHR
jgi:hypothetical protein